jgi:hypothetical protein
MGLGRPFATELAAAARPGISVPAELQARASVGLAQPEALAQRFATRVPEMLAAQPAPTGEGWQDQAVDWVKALLAVRPSGEVTGDSPEAVMSRLEAAVARHDFSEAARLLDQLPPAMKAAAGDVAMDVSQWAGANALVAQLRSAPAGAAQ